MQHYKELEALAAQELHQEGVAREAVTFVRHVDLKYNYQVAEMTLPFPPETSPQTLQADLNRLFTEAHTQAFGYSRDDPVELVSLRLQAMAAATHLQFRDLAQHLADSRPVETTAKRHAYFGPVHGLLDTPVQRRGGIRGEIWGPIIVEESDTTVVVPPGWTVRRDGLGNLVLRLPERSLNQ